MNRQEHVDILNNLGNVRTTRGANMDLAIECSEKAVQLSSDNGRKRAVLLWNVAASFYSRSQVSHRVADIDMGNKLLPSIQHLMQITQGIYVVWEGCSKAGTSYNSKSPSTGPGRVHPP